MNWRLFIPASWDPVSADADADADKVVRCSRCTIPAQVGHAETWQLALDMIDETRSWGIDLPLVIADAGYGNASRPGGTRSALCGRCLRPAHAHAADTRALQPVYAVTGRPPRVQYPEPAQTTKDSGVAAGKAAVPPVSWREGSRPGKGHNGVKRMYSRCVAHRARQAGRDIRKAADEPELPERWLLAEWPPARASRCNSGCRTCPPGCPWRRS
ncbi:transposase [Streptomyces sp. NPDC001139]